MPSPGLFFAPSPRRKRANIFACSSSGTPMPVSVMSTRQNISYSVISRRILPPSGVYFTALSSMLHRASSVHFGSQRTSTGFVWDVRTMFFSPAAGLYCSTALSAMEARSFSPILIAIMPVSSLDVFISASIRLRSFSLWVPMALTQESSSPLSSRSARSWV